MTHINQIVTQHRDEQITVDEVLGTGDGIQTVFPIQLSKRPVDIDTVQIEYTTVSGTFQVTSSNGTFTGTDITSGSVARDGSGSITFSNPLTDTTDLKALDYDVFGMLSEILHQITVPRQIFQIASDGIQTVFNFNFPSVTEVPFGMFRLRWIRQGVPKDTWDDGVGAFQLTGFGTDISTSTIVYDASPNPSANVTFLAPPDTGFVEVWLVDQTEALGGKGWMKLLEERTVTDFSGTTEPDADGMREVVIKNSGVSGKEHIVIGLREYRNVGSQIFGISVALFEKWDHQDDIDAQYYGGDANPHYTIYNNSQNESTDVQKFVMTNDAMEYWLETDKDRVAMFIKNSTLYGSAYWGKAETAASPSVYPRPYIVAASTDDFIPSFNNGLVSIARLNFRSAAWFTPEDSFVTANPTPTNNKQTTNYNRWSNTGQMKKTTNGDTILYDLVFVDTGVNGDIENTARVYFRLKGIFLAPDDSLDSENTINSGQYIVFQDWFRTDYLDFIAMEIT